MKRCHRRRDRQVAGAPPAETIEAELIAAEALLSAERIDEAEHRLDAGREPARSAHTPGAWGEFLRLRGDLRARQTRTTEAYHDIAQSSSVFELVGERYQAAVSQLALAASPRARREVHRDRHYPARRAGLPGARRHARSRGGARGDGAAQTRAPANTSARPPMPTTRWSGGWWMRRVLPDLLARELAAALEAVSADIAVVFVELPGGDVRVIAHAGADADGARTVARAASQGGRVWRHRCCSSRSGASTDGPRVGRHRVARPPGIT